MKRKLKAPTPMRIFWTHGTYEETMRHAETLPAIKRQRFTCTRFEREQLRICQKR